MSEATKCPICKQDTILMTNQTVVWRNRRWCAVHLAIVLANKFDQANEPLLGTQPVTDQTGVVPAEIG